MFQDFEQNDCKVDTSKSTFCINVLVLTRNNGNTHNMAGSLTLPRELVSLVYVFIHDVVIMAGHTTDKCTAGLSVYPLFLRSQKFT